MFTTPGFYQKTRLPVESATTLPPEVYRSPEYFGLESERLFGKSWVAVGYTSQFDEPGKTIAASVGGQPVFLTRDKEGQIRGFFNVCRHRGSLLVEKDCKLERVRCPYHSWTYDLNGQLKNCPLFAMSGDTGSWGGEDGSGASSFRKEDYSLLPIRVETWGCFVFANLDPKAEPLREFLGDLPAQYRNFPLDELVLVRRKKYDIKANWKLIAENFLEYYHLPWVHPELCGVTAIDMHKRNQGAGMYMSFYASPLLQGGTPIDANYLPPMPGLSTEEANAGYFPLVFPNLAMFAMPHHVFALLMTPSGPAHTDEYGDILVHPSVLGRPGIEKELDEILRFYDMVNVQDILAVERVQKGIQAKAYPGGRMSFRFEEPVHRFQNMVIDFMTAERRTYRAD
jgi:choline monooxygenase